ncbi:DNA-directed RNA polymerase II [Actinoplanes sp. NEAU-A12]|uniref:DNA-directed RNA polymerase II n=1 Tax=Actinoplanes sandaracinus TaxID=3045177 RepID=A0ABT6WQQ4_9ACTN|nr:DNA-directed RNA polymerase II [Actinoplanes sandaracinus]MDI6102060.1 DNA-directed RNA polymerase II [Actinoplanes sandaracinus]
MPEQPQWSERTLDMPPQDPWAEEPTSRTAPAEEPTSKVPTSPGPVPPAPDSSPFSQGRARVTQRTEQFRAEHEPTGTGWPEGHAEPRPQRSLGWHVRQLRRGGEWSSAAVLFAFVCWGIWALSEGGNLIGPLIIFMVTLAVAAGVFALARLVGRLVLEQRMGRVRHTARGAHVVAGLFLTVAGFAFLRQTGWVMGAVNWVTGTF